MYFLNKLVMLTQVQIENEQNQGYIFQYIYFESLQIHQKTITHHFKHIDHDIHQGFLFQIL